MTDFKQAAPDYQKFPRPGKNSIELNTPAAARLKPAYSSIRCGHSNMHAHKCGFVNDGGTPLMLVEERLI